MLWTDTRSRDQERHVVLAQRCPGSGRDGIQQLMVSSLASSEPYHTALPQRVALAPYTQAEDSGMSRDIGVRGRSSRCGAGRGRETGHSRVGSPG